MWQKGVYGAHVLLGLLGAFICVGGTYASIQSIMDAYSNGTIGEPRSRVPCETKYVADL